MSTWLVGYDFSDSARLALEYAAEQLVAMGGGELSILYVHLPVPGPDWESDMITGDGNASTQHDYLKQADIALGHVVRAAGAQYPTITIKGNVAAGDASEVINAVAARIGAERIVVGSHGTRGIKRFFLGSVAERIARRATCSVLVVKHPH